MMQKHHEPLEARTLLSAPITFGGSSYDTVSKVISMSDGGTVVAGLFTGTADFDPTSRQVNLTAQPDRADAFIARYSAAGRLDWVRQFSSDAGKIKTDQEIDTPTDPERAGPFDLGVGHDPANLGIYVTGLAADSLGNIYFAGAFRGSVNFLSTGQRVLTSQGGREFVNAYFGRLNIHGGLSFVRQIDADFTVVPNSLAIDSSSNIYLTGYYTRDANFNVTGGSDVPVTRGREDIFTAKYDSVGRLKWLNTPSTDETDRVDRSAGADLAVDSAGEVFITGTFSGETRFNPAVKNGATTIDPVRDTDTFVEKILANGTVGWVTGFGGKGFDGGVALTLSPDGSQVYIGSYFEGTVDANPGAAVLDITASPKAGNSSPDCTDLMLSDFNTADGSLVFAKTLVGGPGWETLGGLATDSSGNVYATGGFYDKCFFDGDPNSTATITSTVRVQKFKDVNDPDRDFSYDVFLAKYDANGTEIFATSFGSASDDFATSLAVNAAGQPIVAGQFRGAYFFPSSTSRLRPIGAQDGFIAEFDTDGSVLTS